MSVSPLERVSPAGITLGRQPGATAAEGTHAAHGSFRPLLGLLTAFWIYVALSNVMYAANMQASLSVQNIHNVYAPWDARIVQHVLLYPLFILSMRGSLRTGWQPLWRALPLQLLCALGFAVLAAPALMFGEYLTGMAHGSSISGCAIRSCAPPRSSARSLRRTWRRCACSSHRTLSSICCIPYAVRSPGTLPPRKRWWCSWEICCDGC